MTDDRLFTIICNLDCVSLTGWKRIVSYIARKERTDVISLLSVALLHAASAPPRSATFGLTLLGGVGAFSFNKVRSMHVRFPALHDVVVDVNGGWGTSVVPGLQLLLPQLASFTSITSLDLSYQGLVSFPASLCALTGLKKLNLFGNKIVALPDAIGDLKELTVLNVGSNEAAMGGSCAPRLPRCRRAPRLGVI